MTQQGSLGEWISERGGEALDWLREIPGVEPARAFPLEMWERLREWPAVDLGLVVPRTWAYMARSAWPELEQDGQPDEIPSKLPTLGLAFGVLADELMGAVMRAVRLSPPHEDIWRIAKETEIALRRLDYAAALDDPTRFHTPPPPLRKPLIERATGYGLDYERLSFHSDYEPLSGLPGRERWHAFEANRTARAYVLRHRDRPRPWLVCLHGFGMGEPRDLRGFRSAWFHEKLGLNVIHPVFPLHGPRRCGRFSGDGVISLEFMHNLFGLGQAIWDIRRCLSWVRQQGAPALGVHGISLGGYTAALLAGLEDGIDCLIAGVPPADMARVMVRHAPPAVRQIAKDEGLFGEAARDLHKVVSPLALEPRVPLERRFIYAGLADRMATPQHAQLLWRHWGRPSIRWYQGSHVSFVWSSEVRRYVRAAVQSCGLTADAAA